MSLKQSLKSCIISFDGEVCPLGELDRVRVHCGDMRGRPYKQSNAERRLRELSEHDNIAPVFNDKGYIVGYRFSLNVKKFEEVGQELQEVMA